MVDAHIVHHTVEPAVVRIIRPARLVLERGGTAMGVAPTANERIRHIVIPANRECLHSGRAIVVTGVYASCRMVSRPDCNAHLAQIEERGSVGDSPAIARSSVNPPPVSLPIEIARLAGITGTSRCGAGSNLRREIIGVN